MAARSDDAITAALRIISYRPRSESELKGKLTEKGYPPGEITAAVEYLAEAGYIDDEKYACALAESRTRNKRWGPVKIAADLKRKGLGKDVVAKAIDSLVPTEEETARDALESWARKKGVPPPLKEANYAKAARHLKARGFSSGAIVKVIAAFNAGDGQTDY